MHKFYFSSKTIAFFLIFIFAASIFHSCTKDQMSLGESPVSLVDDSFLENQIAPNYHLGKIVRANVFGTVVNEDNIPVLNSEVQLKTIHGFQSTTADEDGNFLFANVSVFQNNTFLKVNHIGKFEAFRRINVIEESYNFTKVKLLDKKMIGSLPAIEGGMIQHESNAQIQLMPNSIVDENGEDYLGNVQVAMTWLDPTANDLADRMIGDLSGIDINGKQVALGTFGMLSVELFDNNGEELQLKDGMPATLSFPVPNEILTQAPSEIPLWHYDENLGTWVEEGIATLVGSFYVGTVAHFSSWNVDWKSDAIRVTGEIITRIDNENFIVPYLQIYVSSNEIQQAGGFLDDSGQFEFRNFPADVVFTLRVLGDCDEILVETELGPYSTDTDLGTIFIHAFGENIHHFSGTGVDCDYNPIEDGYVRFRHNEGSTIYPLNDDSNFEFFVNVCNKTEGEIILTDLANKKSSASQEIDLAAPSVHFELLKACEELESFIEIIDKHGRIMYFDQVTAVFKNNWQQGTESINISATSIKGESLSMEVPVVDGIGTYENASANWTRFASYFIQYHLSSNGSQFEITEFGLNNGDVIRGNFEGDVTIIHGEIGSISTASGSFKLIRD